MAIFMLCVGPRHVLAFGWYPGAVEDGFELLGSCRYPPNDFKHSGAGIGLSEISRATHSLGSCACVGSVVSGYENDGSVYAVSNEPLSQFDTGHGTQLDVEHQAAELRMLPVREERLRRRIRDRLKARRTQQPAE
jgi:hypothetical protein